MASLPAIEHSRPVQVTGPKLRRAYFSMRDSQPCSYVTVYFSCPFSRQSPSLLVAGTTQPQLHLMLRRPSHQRPRHPPPSLQAPRLHPQLLILPLKQ